jgi:hypothetical protein
VSETKAVTKRYLVIENRGEIEHGAFTLMGASTKRADGHSIGMFGTGAKYAIAVLMKEHIDVVVASGELKFRFETRPASLRGQEFRQLVLVHGRVREPLSFTTDMGLHWGVDEALRELVSNAYDEGEDGNKDTEARVYVSKGIERITPDGFTRVFIEYTPAVESWAERFNEWFTFKRRVLEEGEQPSWKGGKWKVFERQGKGTRVYRRGVKVFEDRDMHSAFDYQIDSLEVREDRTSDMWKIQTELAYVLDRLTVGRKRKVLEAAAVKGSLESKAYTGYGRVQAEDWIEAVKGQPVVTHEIAAQFREDIVAMAGGKPPLTLPEDWVATLTSDSGSIKAKGVKDVLGGVRAKGYKVVTELSFHERAMLIESLSFLWQNFKYYDNEGLTWSHNRIQVFETPKDDAQLGEYIPDEDAILINRRVFTLGKRELIETLVEEWLHRRTGLTDKTRAFQTALIKELVEVVVRDKGVVL